MTTVECVRCEVLLERVKFDGNLSGMRTVGAQRVNCVEEAKNGALAAPFCLANLEKSCEDGRNVRCIVTRACFYILKTCAIS